MWGFRNGNILREKAKIHQCLIASSELSIEKTQCRICIQTEVLFLSLFQKGVGSHKLKFVLLMVLLALALALALALVYFANSLCVNQNESKHFNECVQRAQQRKLSCCWLTARLSQLPFYLFFFSLCCSVVAAAP